jgi:hypothetical protein
VNAAVLAPDGTVTVLGIVTFELYSESATVNPAAGAAPDNVTVQFDVPGVLTVAGEQLSPLSVPGRLRLTVVVLLCPLQLAVSVAVWSTVTVPAVALKVLLLEPALIVILEGTVSVAWLLDKATVA